MATPSGNRAGAGFISLQGPRGEDGLTPGFPHVTLWDNSKFAGGKLMQQAVESAINAGAVHGDLFIFSPGGELYTFEVISGTPTMTPVGSVAGPDGPEGASAPPVGTHTHVTPPIRFMAGNYGELFAGPQIQVTPVP